MCDGPSNGKKSKKILNHLGMIGYLQKKKKYKG